MIRRILFTLAALASFVAQPAFAQGVKISAMPNGTAVTGTEKIPAVQGGANVNLTPAQLRSFSNGYFIDDYGGDPTGVGNSDTALTSVLTACAATTPKSCIVRFKPGNYHFSSAVVLPNNGDGVDGSYGASQMPIMFVGSGSFTDTSATTKNYNVGTTLWLDSQDSSHAGKLVTLGRGRFTLRNLNIRSGGTVSGTDIPMLYSTNTNLDIDASVSFIGQGTLALPASCTITSDAIVIGKAGTSLHYGTTEASNNQGYAHQINGPNFFNIRHAVLLQDDSNAINLDHLHIWSGCSATANDAAVVIGTGLSGGGPVSNDRVTIDVLEITNWAYGVHVQSPSSGMYIGPVFSFDVGASTLGTVLIDSGVVGSTVIEGLAPAGKPFLVDNNTPSLGTTPTVYFAKVGTGYYSILAPFKSGISGYPDTIGNLLVTGVTGTATTFQPSITSIDGNVLVQALRNSTDTSPGATIWALNYGGGISIGGNNAGNVTNSLSSGASFSANGKTWSANGAMTIDSGAGGSNITYKAFGHLFNTQGGVLLVKIADNIGAGTSKPGIGFGSSTDSYLYRLGAALIATNSVFELPPFTVAGLPTCNATYKGGEAYVTDATAPTYLGTLTGGGAVVAPVFCNGSAWVSH